MTPTCKKALRQTSDYFRQFSRNGRWGTCVDCPRDELFFAYPEFCPNTNRGDHHLTVDQLANRFNIEIKGE